MPTHHTSGLDAARVAASWRAAKALDSRPALLVVDDEEVLRVALRSYFALQGYRVDTCASLLDAVDHIARRDADGARPYAAVISDLRLSGSETEEGLQLLRHVRARSSTLPFVLVTGYATSAAASAAERAGVSAILTKPRPLSELAAVVRRVTAA